MLMCNIILVLLPVCVFVWLCVWTFTDGWLAPVTLNATDALGGSRHCYESWVTDICGHGSRSCGGELNIGMLHLRRRPTAQLWNTHTHRHQWCQRSCTATRKVLSVSVKLKLLIESWKPAVQITSSNQVLFGLFIADADLQSEPEGLPVQQHC